jgi:DNA-binding NarL/FixJ family response regulator
MAYSPNMSNNLKILIADNSAIVLERVSLKVSEIERVEVIGLAKDTPEAISLFDSLRPDAVILDIQMPGGGGLDVLRYIKGRRPDVTVLMMTIFPYAHYREASAQRGADFFMDKSNDIGEIVKVINDLARGFVKQDDG